MNIRTILIIDDDVVLLARMATQLKQAGYETLQAADVRQAERQLNDTAVDLVLLDTAMGRGAGWEALPRIAARAPTIVISGDGLEEDIVRGLEAGAVDYLAKPFRTGELLARIRVRLPANVATETPLHDEPVAQMPAEQPAIDQSSALPPLAERVIDLGADEESLRRAGNTTSFASEGALDIADETPAQRIARSRRSRKTSEEEEPVFIPHSEERHLLDSERESAADGMRVGEIEQLPLGQRLRAARQRRRITLVQAELDSRIRMSYIQAMEEEKFSLLPHGPIAEQMVQTYSNYLGLNATQAVEEYRRHHYNAPLEPLFALGGDSLPRQAPPWWLWAVAVALALSVGIGGILAFDPAGVAELGERARLLIAPPTATNTATARPTMTPQPPTATPEPSPSPSPTRTRIPTATPTATETATPEPTATNTAVPRPPATARPQPTATPEPPTPEPQPEPEPEPQPEPEPEPEPQPEPPQQP